MSCHQHQGSWRKGRWTGLLAACTTASLLGCGAPPKPVEAPLPAAAAARETQSQETASTLAGPTTLLGVYTAEQAARGKDVYAGTCKSCHTPASHTGATFNERWRGKQLSDLFTYVSTKMPDNDPGSLSPGDAADVVAYLLQLNAMPVGSSELPPNPDSLAHFRIENRSTIGPTTH